MNIAIRKIIPNGDLTTSGENGLGIINMHKLLADKKVVLFGIPGAFTRNCSEVHFPSFVSDEAKFYAHGFDLIACLSVNDTKVMAAWKKTFPENKILMISDADASYSKAVGLDIDEGIEAGIRCSRFAAIINNLVVEAFWIDESGIKNSHADAVLKYIENNREALQ